MHVADRNVTAIEAARPSGTQTTGVTGIHNAAGLATRRVEIHSHSRAIRPTTSEKPHLPPAGITFLADLDRDLRTGLAAEIRALWTHTSTALEGNTLTLGDTAFVLQEGLTVSGKPLKDHQEIIVHAKAIDLVYAIIDQCRRVTADDLHQIHRAVQTELVMDAFNPVGRWKVENNGNDRTAIHGDVTVARLRQAGARSCADGGLARDAQWCTAPET